MLQELRVENLLLIERAELRFSAGLNVLTGETGAGKTVLAHALDLLLGGRARQGIVRPGAAEAYVEGTFDLPEGLPAELAERLSPDAAEIVLARRVSTDGRTKAYLNGRSANVSELRDLGGLLLSFYGQHEHRRLTVSGAQLQILDGLCGEAQIKRLRDGASAHARVRELSERMAELNELAGSRERELGLLEYELGEIDELAPDAEEHEQLRSARERLRRQDALVAAAAAGAEALGGDGGQAPGATQLLALAGGALEDVAGVDPALDGLAERLRAAAIESQELAGELRDYGAGALDGLPALDIPGLEPTLEGVEERLQALERLLRKHGGTVEAVLAYADEARARHEQLAGAEVAIEQTGAELELARADLQARAGALRKARKAAAKGFASEVAGQLTELAMEDAGFEVTFGEIEAGPAGADTVEFLLASNPGVPAGPLREIASGGELSRVMLAIMSAGHTLRARRPAAAPQTTLVFDEVDAGIGGRTANAVGARLQALGARGQVICITHLPQIASLGARHFSIVKDTGADPTRASVLELAESEVVTELVRMLGADSEDGAALRHARDLRRAA
ncbi:MAG TPA: DNA repair protein RecN [Solirubrobacteraceae bacterium]|jgi:DNA repair protein RecN (Recombination protein N)|nr:DNA repair protein RecN [Solirubrobacteraceae bacterium]